MSTAERPPPPPSSSSGDENAADVSSPPPSPSPPPPQQPFVVGDLVFVEHRSWPGMNKHGGVALVTAVLDPPGSRYDVKYSVSRKFDRGVEARYVHPYAFPEEAVGGRSRRVGGGSGSGSRSSRGRPIAPVIAPTTSARSAGSTGSAASTAVATATPMQQPPLDRDSADTNGGQVPMSEEEEEEGSDREHTPSTAGGGGTTVSTTSTRPPAAAVATAASSPARFDAVAGGSSLVAAPAIAVFGREGEDGQGRDGDTSRRHHDDDGENTCDGAGEVSCQSDAAQTEEAQEEEKRVNSRGCPSHNGDGGYGGGSLDFVRDDDNNGDNSDMGDGDGDGGSNTSELSTAAPLAGGAGRVYPENRPAAGGKRGDGEGETEGPAVALSPSGTPEKGIREEGTGETREEEEEEEKDLAHDGKQSSVLPSVGISVDGIATGVTAAPLSPTSRSNIPWRPMGLAEGLEKEQPRGGHRRPRDPPLSAPSSGERDPHRAGAAEGLMALFANNSATTSVSRVEGEREEHLSVDKDKADDVRAQTQTLSPPRPKNNSALDRSSSSSSIDRGEVVASAGPELPLGVLAAAAALKTPASPSGSRSRHSSRLQQNHDNCFARAAGSGGKDNDGDVPPASDPTRPESSTRVAPKRGVGACANSSKSRTPSASPPSPLLPSRPSGQTAVGWQQQHVPRQAMPPPPPPPPSLLSPTPNASSSSARPAPLPPMLTPKAPAFKVGDLVSVPSRSSPGINKEGGVAKVTLAHRDGTFDVKYIVRKGKEKGVAGAILSSYAVDDDNDDDSSADGGGSGSGSGSTSRDTRGRDSAGAVVATASGPSSSPSVEVATRGSARNPAVRRTSRANKGWCSPDIAAGQANAACLSYLLGETQHQDLVLDPDLGELLDPSEYSKDGIESRNTNSAPVDEARRHREASSGVTAVVNAAEEEKREGMNDDVTAASGREVRGGGDGVGGRGRSRGNGKRKRTARDGDGSDDEGDGDGGVNEQQVSGDDRGRSSQGRGRRRRRSSAGSTSTGEGSTGGTRGGVGGASSKDVVDISALIVENRSGDNAAALATTAVTDSDGRSCAGLAARVPAAAAAATADKKRGRSSGSATVLRVAAAAADGDGELPGTKKKSKATVAKAGASSNRGGGGGQGVSVNGRRGRVATAAETEAGGSVVLTMSGSTAEMSRVANSLAKR